MCFDLVLERTFGLINRVAEHIIGITLNRMGYLPHADAVAIGKLVKHFPNTGLGFFGIAALADCSSHCRPQPDFPCLDRAGVPLVRFVLSSDSQSPSNRPLGRRVPRVFLRRERFIGLGNNLTSTSPASKDARIDRCFFGPILLVEFRTNADFHVIAASKQRHH
jgi:hypothetical protein